MRHPTPTRPHRPQSGKFPENLPARAKLPPWVRYGALCIGLSLFSAAQGATTTHAFTEPGGATLAGEVLSVKNGEVAVRRADGKVFSLDVQSLTAEDRAYVATWKALPAPPPDPEATTDSDLEIKITVAAVESAEARAPATGQLVAKVNLLNRETELSFKGLKGTLVLIGEAPGAPRRLKVLAVQKFAGDLPAQGKYDFTGAPFAEAAASRRGGALEYHYNGYLFILQNAQNNIIMFRRVGTFPKTGTEALAMPAGAEFTAARAPSGRSRPTATAPGTGDFHSLTSVLPLPKT
jgi:hypothetical protein